MRFAHRPALTIGSESLDYATLHKNVAAFAAGVLSLGLAKSERVGVYLDKRFETAASFFGTALAGGIFVPLNPLLKPAQVSYILRDCNVRMLVTTVERHTLLNASLKECPDLQHVVVINAESPLPLEAGLPVHRWQDLLTVGAHRGNRVIDTDITAILYTSGSTGMPKGVVLSHRNMVAGAKSVASYLENTPDDTLLAALPLSFDAGLSQLTTAFHVGARVVLINYLLPKDVINALVRESSPAARRIRRNTIESVGIDPSSAMIPRPRRPRPRSTEPAITANACGMAADSTSGIHSTAMPGSVK